MDKNTMIGKLLECGVLCEQAEIIADVLITADMYGVKTHGARTLDAHIERIHSNGYNLAPVLSTVRKTNAFAVIDGDNAIGFVSAVYCMRLAIQEAKKQGMYHVYSRHNNTFGPAFYYPLLAAQDGMIGIIFSNSPAQMPPQGGKEKLLGTNPFAMVIPIPGKDPIIFDMASSVVAKSKLLDYKMSGQKLPDGWALDIDGKPTNDPDKGLQGLILPFGGYKGYGIALLIDILAGVLSGAAYLNKVGRFYTNSENGMDTGFCCVAIDPYAVLGEEYDIRINDFETIIRTSEPVSGCRITLPGDRKHNELQSKYVE